MNPEGDSYSGNSMEEQVVPIRCHSPVKLHDLLTRSCSLDRLCHRDRMEPVVRAKSTFTGYRLL